MNYIGKWVFDSIGTQDDEKGMIYLNGDEYLASPMPYIDETDEEAVADEIDKKNALMAQSRYGDRYRAGRRKVQGVS